MKITREALLNIIKEEMGAAEKEARAAYEAEQDAKYPRRAAAARSPEEVFASVDESLNQAHKDLQMLSLLLKNGGFDTQPVEKIFKDVEHDIVNLNGLVKEDVEKLGSLKGPLERGTRDK
jgi:signal recognition particle subunit SEC65